MLAEPGEHLLLGAFRPRPAGGPGRALLRTILTALAALAVCTASSGRASAFCRTTTCPLPPQFAPSDGECVPPDFDQWCASQSPPAKILPVYWSNACVSYDIQANASKQVPYDKAVELFAAAFAKWTNTRCPSEGDGRISIDVKNLGPVACDKVQYNSDQGNQHVILFYDTGWPYEADTNNTLGLTTITFNPDTGEIYDADMAIKSTPDTPLSLRDPVPRNGYDFQSIITHETGHFLGMAHSGNEMATMFAHYTQGTTWMRTLSADDTDGICSIYLPNGDRSVDRSVSASGTVAEAACDPTPRHGWQSVCAQTLGCSLSGDTAAGARTGRGWPALLAIAQAIAAAARRRARPRRM
jgi:hypothetical protein